jgi:hypothetical protein
MMREGMYFWLPSLFPYKKHHHFASSIGDHFRDVYFWLPSLFPYKSTTILPLVLETTSEMHNALRHAFLQMAALVEVSLKDFFGDRLRIFAMRGGALLERALSFESSLFWKMYL